MDAHALVPVLLTLGRPSALATMFDTMAERLDPYRRPPGQGVILRIFLDGTREALPPEADGPVIYLPEKASSAEEWSASVLVRTLRHRVLEPQP